MRHRDCRPGALTGGSLSLENLDYADGQSGEVGRAERVAIGVSGRRFLRVGLQMIDMDDAGLGVRQPELSHPGAGIDPQLCLLM